MHTATTARAPARRPGMTLIEVIIAVMILSGVLIGLSNFTRRFQHLTENHDALAIASELATGRLEVVGLSRPYASLVATFDGTSETSASSNANPPMTAYPGYTRTTSVVRTGPTSTGDYVTVTVTVTHVSTSTTIRKSLVIAAF